MEIFEHFYQEMKNADIADCAREENKKEGILDNIGGVAASLYPRAQSAMSASAPVKAEYADKCQKTMSAMSANLPDGCPLVTGVVPDGCRFHPLIFNRLVGEGVLSAEDGCPIRQVCKL